MCVRMDGAPRKRCIQVAEQHVPDFVRKSEVKSVIKAEGLLCGSDVFEILNKKIYDIVISAVSRASMESRKTVRGEDFF